MKAVIIFFFSCLLTFGEGLVFEKSLMKVEAVPDQDFVEVQFPFTVKGEQPSVIKNSEAPCTCLSVKIGEEDRKIWQPGESSYVTGIFEVGTFRGTVKKKIYLTMNSGKRHSLTVEMTTPKLIQIEPKTLKWKIDEEPKEQSLKIALSPNYPINIKTINNSNPRKFSHELVTIVEGKEYQLKIAPNDTESRALGVIRITTDSPNKRHKNYQAFIVVEQEGFGPRVNRK